MKKSLLLLLLLVISAAGFAQSISVAEFKYDEEDNTASDEATAKSDQNGEDCAVIKIITSDTGFSYDVGAYGVTDIDTTHVGQIWLYVPGEIKSLTLYHQVYGVYEYPFTIPIEGGKTYRMALNLNGVATETGSERLTFTCNPQTATLKIDEVEVPLTNGMLTETYGVGVHSYVVEADGYIPHPGTFEILSGSPASVEVELTKIEERVESNIDWNTQQAVEYIVPGEQQVKFKMIPVKPAEFFMGVDVGGGGSFEDELPSHRCNIGGFFIGETEVTQELWMAVMGTNPSRFQSGDQKDLPVEQVSWNDCQAFISRLSGILGHKFRLPTEAEWEYAAKNGLPNVSSVYNVGLGTQAWYCDNSEGSTHTVATKEPTYTGFYDMLGNVSEWCQDWYQPYTSQAQENPKGGRFGTHKVSRGGNWLQPVWNCRTTSREMNTPDVKSSTIGLRLAM